MRLRYEGGEPIGALRKVSKRGKVKFFVQFVGLLPPPPPPCLTFAHTFLNATKFFGESEEGEGGRRDSTIYGFTVFWLKNGILLEGEGGNNLGPMRNCSSGAKFFSSSYEVWPWSPEKSSLLMRFFQGLIFFFVELFRVLLKYLREAAKFCR